MLLVAWDRIHWLPFKPNAELAHIHSVHLPSFQGIGTIGIFHNAVVVKSLSDFMIPDSHIFDVSIAAHTINRVMATQNTEIMSFARGMVQLPIFITINHHKMLLDSEAIFAVFKFDMM